MITVDTMQFKAVWGQAPHENQIGIWVFELTNANGHTEQARECGVYGRAAQEIARQADVFDYESVALLP